MINKHTLETIYSCGCIIWNDDKGEYEIEYCPTHKAAPALVKAGHDLAMLVIQSDRYNDDLNFRDVIDHWFAVEKQAREGRLFISPPPKIYTPRPPP
ncbi:unnamed protein product [marine sediment metagenome]|uniref:Uncharacterized protein n=1 Tax=marine sediment metagenome TaxID=412755 RepID=X1DT36_9ZZZZ